MYKKLGILSVTTCLLSGCVDFNGARNQTIVLETPLVEGAECDLTDNRGKKWYVAETPEVLTITKGHGPIVIDCTKKGYKRTITQVEEFYPKPDYQHVATSAMVGMRDLTSNIGKQYPSRIVIMMEPKEFADEQQRVDWLVAKQSYDKMYQSTIYAQNKQNDVPDDIEYRLIQQIEALEAKQREAEERVLEANKEEKSHEESLIEKEQRIKLYIERRAQLKEQLRAVQEQKGSVETPAVEEDELNPPQPYITKEEPASSTHTEEEESSDPIKLNLPVKNYKSPIDLLPPLE